MPHLSLCLIVCWLKVDVGPVPQVCYATLCYVYARLDSNANNCRFIFVYLFVVGF